TAGRGKPRMGMSNRLLEQPVESESFHLMLRRRPARLMESGLEALGLGATMRKLGWVAALSALALGVTGVAEAQIARHGRPLYGHAEVNRGFMPDPHVMQGVMGGSLQASTLSPTCRGYVNPQPSHVIRSRTGFQNLRVVVSGQGDSTLMIMLPNGAVLCDDDSGGGREPLI